MMPCEPSGDWDYVVVGGGLAGIIVAARLSEDPACRVLLLEAGRRRRSPLLAIPAGETLLMGDPRYDWRFETEPDTSLGERTLSIPCGKLLGGSNAINGMLFVRGQRDDYDAWARQGLTDWGWEDVLPWFRSLEDWAGGQTGARGAGGAIRVELPRQREPLCDAFIAAGVRLGHAPNPDYNSGDQEGFGYYQCTQRAGRRHSVLEGYLKRAARRDNLAIVTGALASRLLFAGSRCTGVEYSLEGGPPRQARCRRETVLCAGVIGSCRILQLSGIGNPHRLRAAGIAPRLASPEVGENLRDHFAARLRWRVNRKVTYNERTRGVRLGLEAARYALTRRGVLSLPIAIGFGFVRSRPQEHVPDLQFHFAPGSYGAASLRRLEREPGMTIGVYPSRPQARGSVHVQSPAAAHPPRIATGFLDSEEDCRRLVAGVRLALRLAATAPLRGYVAHALAPAPTEDEDAILDFVRATGATSFHPVGTCRMGADAASVTDPDLRVRGVDRLRVIDASVMPTMVSGNTQAATMMIAERGAHLLRRAARGCG